MPYVTVSTNLPKEEIPSNFTVEFAEELARILNRRIQTMTIILHADLSICRFGTSGPTLSVMLRDVQPFDDKEKNRQISKDVISFIEKNLNVEPARMTITFVPDDPSRVGFADGVLLYGRHVKNGKQPPQ